MTPSNVLGSPRTTLGGLYTILLNSLIQSVIPQVAAYFGTQPGLLWTVLGGLLALLPAALMADTKKPGVTGSPAVGGSITPLVLLAAGGLLLAAPARADEPLQPGGLLPQAGTCFHNSDACVQPAATVIPYVVDFRSGNVAQNIGFGVGYALVFPKALSPSFTPGVEVLAGTQTGGGWNAAIMPRLGTIRIGVVVTHKPGVTYGGLGVGLGI